LLWTFAGGDPQASTDDTVTVVYNIAGTWDVSLVAENTKFADGLKVEKLVVVKPLPNPGFGIAVDKGQDVTFSNTTTYGNSYFWNFGDNATSDIQNPKHTYVKDGTYTVTLVATNDCGSKSVVQKVTVITPPTAAFLADTLTGCPPFKVQYKSTISSNSNDIKWTFEKGIPSSSNLPNPIITYGETGNWDAQLVVSNVAGKDSVFKNNYVTVKALPEASFAVASVVGKLVSFKNNSTNATNYTWDFGDKSAIVKDANPKHGYLKSGTFMVKLNATNECGTNTAEAEVIIQNQVNCSDLGLVFRPNPTYDISTVNFGGDLASPLTYLISTIDGRVLERGTIAKDLAEKEFDLSYYPAGVYIFYFKCDEKTVAQKVMHVVE
jgi:PKD repeat protein